MRGVEGGVRSFVRPRLWSNRDGKDNQCLLFELVCLCLGTWKGGWVNHDEFVSLTQKSHTARICSCGHDELTRY